MCGERKSGLRAAVLGRNVLLASLVALSTWGLSACDSGSAPESVNDNQGQDQSQPGNDLVEEVSLDSTTGTPDSTEPDGSLPDIHTEDLPADAPDMATPDAEDLDPGDAHPDTVEPDVTEPCYPPAYSSSCDEVTDFQCGFGVECVNGVIDAYWHFHLFCEGQEVEEIVDYNCGYVCPHGCMPMEEPYYGWPSDGKQLVAELCAECQYDVDCAFMLPPDGKVGTWGCKQGLCVFQEGPACLGMGEKFTDFETEGKCCDGLVPAPDCEWMDGNCSCPKCPCYVCLPCGNGICDAAEHLCNCPEDCK